MGETYTTDEDEKQRSVDPCRHSNISRVSDMIPRRPSRIEENQGRNQNGHDNFHTISTEDLSFSRKMVPPTRGYEDNPPIQPDRIQAGSHIIRSRRECNAELESKK